MIFRGIWQAWQRSKSQLAAINEQFKTLSHGKGKGSVSQERGGGGINNVRQADASLLIFADPQSGAATRSALEHVYIRPCIEGH